MSDPLSIAGSVAGLVGITIQIAKLAKQLYDSGEDAPKSILRIKEEMDNLNIIFCQVEALIGSRSRNRPSKSRLKMVSLHHLATILTGCVLYYSELDKKLSEVAGLEPPATGPNTQANRQSPRSATGLLVRIKWSIWTEAEVAVIIENLERQKSSLHLMLTIFNCNTTSEAEESLEKLHKLVEKISDKIAESNNDIAFQLRELISIHHTGSSGLPDQDDEDSDCATTQTMALSSLTGSATASDIDSFDDGASIRITATTISLRSIRSIIPSFTEELKKSRPYKRLWRRGIDPNSESHSVFSKDSRATKGDSWSMLSDLSLGDLSISEISVLELPIALSDLYNPAPYQVAKGHRGQKPLLRSVKWSPRGRLHSAIDSNNLFALRAMLTLGANPDEENDEGRTPLWYATEHGQSWACRILLKNGATVDSTDSTGRTPLVYAAEKGNNIRICQMLLENGAAVDSTDSTGRTPLSYAVTGDTTHYDRLGLCKLLLANGAAVDSTDSTGRTPLSYAAAAAAAAHYDKSESCKLLLANGAAVDSRDSTGRTPLSYAAEKGDYMTYQMLLENGAAVDSTDSTGRTPLSYAAAATRYDRSVSCKVLLANGAAVDSRDSTGRTPLSYAAEDGDTEACVMLLEEGAAVDSTDSTGRTPLSYAAQAAGGFDIETEYMCKLLLENGADVNSTDSTGRTPLSYAAQHGKLNTCQALVRNGATVFSTDFTGRKPLDYAQAREDGDDIANFLQSAASPWFRQKYVEWR